MNRLSTAFQINDDVLIPAVGFGTYLIPPAETAKAVASAVECGYRHIDTASIYENEVGTGEGIQAGLKAAQLKRTDVFVTTKLWPGNPGWGEAPRSGPETTADFDDSLKRLGLDYLDLYLIHSPHGGAKRLEQWEALLKLKKAGKVRAVGVSNFNQNHLEEIRLAGLPAPDVNQIELHPWSQKPDLVAYMTANGISPIAYSSLAPLSTWRTGAGQDSAKPKEEDANNGIFKQLAAKYGVSEAQFLLRWGVQNGYAVLPKSLNPVRMRQNLDLFGFEIDTTDMKLITAMDRGNGIAWAIGDPTQVK